MKTLVFITSHVITKALISEYKKMSKVKGIDCILALDNEALKMEFDNRVCEKEFFGNKVNCLFFDSKLNNELNLPCYSYNIFTNDFSKVMWYNADYRFFYVKKYFPDYDYYWQFEFDIFCNGESYQPFFDKYSEHEKELSILNYKEAEINGKWCHSKDVEWAYKDTDIYSSFFPICKLSNSSIDYLYERRQYYSKIYEKIEDKSHARWQFAELFVPTELTNAGYKFVTLEEPQITFDKEYDLNEDRLFEHPDNKLYHPVKGQFIMRENKLLTEKNKLSKQVKTLRQETKELLKENKKLTNQLNKINKQNSQLTTKINKLERFKINILGIKISHRRKV